MQVFYQSRRHKTHLQTHTMEETNEVHQIQQEQPESLNEKEDDDYDEHSQRWFEHPYRKVVG
jgi:hypothetical protein